jgi:arylsulfatase A-like enzyme
MTTAIRCRFCLALLLAVLVTPAGELVAQSRPVDAKRPNVVLFLIDDLGWIDTGAYGSRFYETPHIDALARRGMRFTDAYSANPLCSPTRASILTGKYPARLGLTSAAGHQPPLPKDSPQRPESAPPNRPIIQPETLRYLDPAEYTLAEALHDAGYATGHFGKWHLGLTEEFWPERQGYDVAFHGHPDPGPSGPNGYFSPYGFKTGTVTSGPEGEYIVDRVTDEAIRFIETKRDKPFFAAVWQYGVHGPWDYKEEYAQAFVDKTDPRGKQSNPVMAAMLRSVDECVGRVVAKLDELGLAENTIILFTSDNGGNVHSNVEDDAKKQNVEPGHPQWRAVSRYRKYAGFLPPTNNFPLRSGKGTLYEGGYRVPLIFVWPGRIAPGTTSSNVSCSIDFYPTLLDLAGVAPNPVQKFDGVSLAPVLRGDAEDVGREAVFNYFPHGGPSKPPGATVRKGDWKLIRWFETGPDYTSTHELYNLAVDLGETTNLAAQHPDLVRELDALIDRFFAETGAVIPIPNPAYQAQPRETSADAFAKWVPKNSETAVTAEGVQVFASGRAPAFLGKAGVRGKGNLELRVRLRSAPAGAGRIQWRTTAQETFPADGQTAPYQLTGGEWQEAAIRFAVPDGLAQMRLYLPAGANPAEVDWIELWQAGDKPVRLDRWDLGTPQ